MGIHINARKGEIASTVLMPGDPLRAKYVAEKFLSKVSCYNDVRGMYGYTGEYLGNRISIQSTGMGIPSMGIYAHELIAEYSCDRLIRIGTAGAINRNLKLGDIAVAISTATDSSFIKNEFPTIDYSPSVSVELLFSLEKKAKTTNQVLHFGNFFTSDHFFNNDYKLFEKLSNHNCIAVEMETASLYMLAEKFGVKALAMCTISDLVIEGHHMSPGQRQTGLDTMIQLALDTFSNQ